MNLEETTQSREQPPTLPVLETTPGFERDVEGQTKRLGEIAETLKRQKPVEPVSVRTFLNWFWGSQRRGKFIVSHIRQQLQKAGLVTDPDFESAYIDAQISFKPYEGASEKSIEPASKTLPQDWNATVKESQGSLVTPTLADPTYRISKLAAANKMPSFVRPDSSLAETLTVMMANDFSQLPVMTSERDVKGVVSWKSIGVRLGLGQILKCAKDAMEPAAEIQSDASLFAAIPLIVEHDYTLVRANDRAIVGIITTSDLSLQFKQLSEPFLLIGEIENHIRNLISSKFSATDLVAARDPEDKARQISSAADLTFGEYKRLLEQPEKWNQLRLKLDRTVFIRLLDQIRDTRNDVMHFDPDGIEDDSMTALRDFVRLFRTLLTLRAL